MGKLIKPDTILILDFGGQYSHLIGKRVRENKVYSEVFPCDISPREIKLLNKKLNIKGIILSGGPSSVYDRNTPKFDSKIFDTGVPILGLCYGHQLIAYLNNGKVQPGAEEYGLTHVEIDKPVDVLQGLSKKEIVWMSHSDFVYELPKEYEVLSHSKNCPIAAFKHREKPIFGLQWHPEVVHTKNGTLMIKNFIFKVCACIPNWIPESFIEKAIDEIKLFKNNKCIVALSGGIDSSTTAALASKVIGRNLTAVFIDHGFMRKSETEFVRKTFKKFGMNLVIVDAKKRFMKKIRGVVDPEQKRKIIGKEFIRVFEKIASEVGAEYLLQGTIYPDRVESGVRRDSDKIKTHHNVAGLPIKIKFKTILEPLKDLYKDEVRKVAEKLDLPREIVWRQPFPGPGLAVRVVGEVTEEKIGIVKKADDIVAQELEKSGINEGLWQYFAVLTNTKSTGVKGDARAYGYAIVIRAVESKEAMTASFAKIPYDILEKISTRITNEIPQITRVVYDITHKPPATIEWE
ncbi:MAG: glutamine-hydrolyzing GMP synthase [Candidatus Methylarchaceae archaeon HK02M2]|nr:glutamine-hydrolyzing GMP synthase [Candidatus Methylarchaceae archaeon HK02M2]